MGWLGLAGLPDCAHGRALFSWYVLLLMALYVPAGWVVSRLRGWPRPDRKTGCKAVLYPALCAWGWAFGGCGLLLLFSGREALFPLAFTALPFWPSPFCWPALPPCSCSSPWICSQAP